MDFIDNELKVEHFLLDTRVCKECGQEKSLLADFYRLMEVLIMLAAIGGAAFGAYKMTPKN